MGHGRGRGRGLAPADAQALAKWCDWIEAWAARSDPARLSAAEILADPEVDDYCDAG